MADEKPTGLGLLRQPFPAHHISKLPKESKAQIEERKTNRNAGTTCAVCGSWHHKSAVHLDYVGHAALTDRLLDADPEWAWEPLAIGPEGLPVIDRHNGLWIRLTVRGVSRLGYGHADGKSGGDAIKEAIGDALRNAAMRFGAALDLWHKGGPLHPETEEVDDAVDTEYQNWLLDLEATTDKGLQALMAAINGSPEPLKAKLRADLKAWTALKTKASAVAA